MEELRRDELRTMAVIWAGCGNISFDEIYHRLNAFTSFKRGSLKRILTRLENAEFIKREGDGIYAPIVTALGYEKLLSRGDKF